MPTVIFEKLLQIKADALPKRFPLTLIYLLSIGTFPTFQRPAFAVQCLCKPLFIISSIESLSHAWPDNESREPECFIFVFGLSLSLSRHNIFSTTHQVLLQVK